MYVVRHVYMYTVVGGRRGMKARLHQVSGYRSIRSSPANANLILVFFKKNTVMGCRHAYQFGRLGQASCGGGGLS
jgi:hypothetical protein